MIFYNTPSKKIMKHLNIIIIIDNPLLKAKYFNMFPKKEIQKNPRQKARDLRKTAWWRKKIAPGKCYYCHQIFKPSELTMDHIIPLAQGGTSDKINIVPACKECNNQKKYLLPLEWIEYKQKFLNNKYDTKRGEL